MELLPVAIIMNAHDKVQEERMESIQRYPCVYITREKVQGFMKMPNLFYVDQDGRRQVHCISR